MLARRLLLRSFRSHEHADVALGAGLTVVWGPNGVGKTNLLEGLYFACTGRSCRTTNDREAVTFGADLLRCELHGEDEAGAHVLAVGFSPGEDKHFQVDGAAVASLLEAPSRPLVSVFLPDRLELVKGPPAVRRAHLDQLLAALWPARVGTRRGYRQALAQRNALLARVRSGASSRTSLAAWDAELAGHALALMADRREAVELLGPGIARIAGDLGLDGLEIAYRPRSGATDERAFAAELADRLEGDLERGFTGHGPHRDELLLRRDGRDLRAFGSQGQQRIAVLALLLAERELIAELRGRPPLLLLDDVMSELDATRRELLVSLLREGAGQSVVTTTDLAHVPGSGADDVVVLELSAPPAEAQAA